ncbi:MAG TPA: SRPBCC family protein [Tepidisphaeraceae bacterium]|jgi:ligand-binding SRPBCC domain-containing protein
MYRLAISTFIRASPQICFDLARSVDVHLQSASDSDERVIAGRNTGLLELGDEVTWQGKHLGFTHRLSSKIIILQPPDFFQDRMMRGPFGFLEHDHRFEPQNNDTQMTDVLTFQAPFGPIGWLAERLILAPHLRRFLMQRATVLKQLAEQQPATSKSL